jgi:hypothetical protein
MSVSRVQQPQIKRSEVPLRHRLNELHMAYILAKAYRRDAQASGLHDNWRQGVAMQVSKFRGSLHLSWMH